LYRDRIDKLVNILKKENVNGYLMDKQSDLFYFTGISKLNGYWLLITDKQKVIFFLPELLLQQIKDIFKNKNETKNIEFIKIKKISEDLKQCLIKNNIKIIGVDPEKISYSSLMKLKKHFHIKLLPNLIDKLRMIKTQEEINNIKISCQYAVKIMKEIKNYIKPGLTEKQIYKKILHLILNYDLEPSFEPIVASGVNSSYPHHISDNTVIKQNDIVLIDLGCKYNGYCSDLTRIFFLGKIEKSVIMLFDILKKVQKKIIENIKPNKKASELDFIARKLLEKYNLEDKFIHNTGHGIGIKIHEIPMISQKEKLTLQPNMIITIEPGIYMPNMYGFRIEDCVLVKNNTIEILTKGI